MAGYFCAVLMSTAPYVEQRISVTVLQYNTTDESERQALHRRLTSQARLDDESASDTILLQHTINNIELDFSFFDLPEVVDYMDGRIVGSIRANDCYVNSLRGIPDSTVELYVRHCRVTSLQHVPSKASVLNLIGNPIARIDDVILEHPRSIDHGNCRYYHDDPNIGPSFIDDTDFQRVHQLIMSYSGRGVSRQQQLSFVRELSSLGLGHLA